MYQQINATVHHDQKGSFQECEDDIIIKSMTNTKKKAKERKIPWLSHQMLKKASDENLTSDTDRNSYYLSDRRVPPPQSLLK